MKQALLLIDIQNDYFNNDANPLVDANQAGEQAKKLLQHFRDQQLTVVHM